MDQRPRLHCPVCRAGFRSNLECPRCGADLEPLMTLAARAHQARRTAREALLRGDWSAARHSALLSQELHATRAGRRLWLLAGWLETCPHMAPRTGESQGSDEICNSF